MNCSTTREAYGILEKITIYQPQPIKRFRGCEESGYELLDLVEKLTTVQNRLDNVPSERTIDNQLSGGGLAPASPRRTLPDQSLIFGGCKQIITCVKLCHKHVCFDDPLTGGA